MTTEAGMIAKIATIPLDPFSVNLNLTKQYDREVWVLSGKTFVPMPDGTKRYLYEVEIVEPAT